MADRVYPALRITFFETPGEDQIDYLLAELDEHHPTAIDEIPNGLLAFFASAAARDAAETHLAAFELVDVVAEDVPDEQWAERSQAALTPVTIGKLTVAPPWTVDDALRASAPGPIVVIQPSMGFGTGHHASTRLCLDLIQSIPLAGARVLDVGTGSGVLAIAARMLGAREVKGVDVDPDAIANALENLELNPAVSGLTFEQFDLESLKVGLVDGYDIVLANLTGAMLQRTAGHLGALAARRAQLIISGFQVDEASEVAGAFQGWRVAVERVEATWVGALLERA